MELATCKGCGRLFNVIVNKKLCPNCINKLEEKFQEVKTYLNEHPNAPVNKVSEECGVSVKQIKTWVREERLSFTSGSADGITCDGCGQVILTGRFCVHCKQKMQSNLMGAIDAPKMDAPRKREHDRDRMRFLQNL